MDDRYSALRLVYGEEAVERVKQAKILVIGGGGIGCEILKNLVLAGILHVTVIDLDTIDVSNLNRQFLFRPEHVGQSKALIAASAAMAFNSDAQVTGIHGNVKDKEVLDVSKIKGYSLVLNALDNAEARKHVNRLCRAANVLLIDSGTTGYMGQVQVTHTHTHTHTHTYIHTYTCKT